MKSQDVLLLLKLISLHVGLDGKDGDSDIIQVDGTWEDWDEKGLKPTFTEMDQIESRFSLRNLEGLTGISKSQISLSLNRMYSVGLAKVDRKLQVPKTNTKALLEFIAYGIRYVFPAKEGVIGRGIATSIAAPVLRGKLMTSGELQPVWSNPRGNTKGMLIEPLHPKVFLAVQQDAQLYAMLALVDAIRIGHPRERNLALEMLNSIFKVAK
ncbi:MULTISPECIES: hypothetical protein [Pseudoalteromonas]|uniref:hypothetical protein n=1 Tax=Pseudoalteromonas TaxID=53246 RepID=UPI000407EBC7|nr:MULTISPECIES: hypothetical protein [Pseudoalteromonas]MBE3675004.1 hypothetical protein [Pseudoalteromonas distincta KMM 3548]MBH0061894.1 hypothetical protein [Pseudoalteromonas sp. NZS71]MBZ2193315.1 hypothetical protein [Pseudoalteromonas arctica]MDC3214648.1 hypothetical protein [Pseudoalteromonas distincta]PKG66757.1 hypothetical protein CXF75_03600 [Pseudoalteromonas arctica]